MLVGRGFPYFNSCRARSHDPRSKDYEPIHGLGWAEGFLQFSDLLPPFEYPYSNIATVCFSTPGGEYTIFPGKGSRDITRCLRSSQKDQVQTLQEIVGV